MKLPIKEFQFSFSRSSGSGGQNVNKVNTKVTLKWDLKSTKVLSPDWKKRFQEKYKTNITSEGFVIVTSQRFRTQARNITDCTDKITKWLKSTRFAPRKRVGTKPTRSSVEKRLKGKQQRSEVKKSRRKVDSGD